MNSKVTDEEIRGRVFDIQRWSLQDGPGIRTTVFLKGCSLACEWCANPESWLGAPEMAYFTDKCIGAGRRCARSEQSQWRTIARPPIGVFVAPSAMGKWMRRIPARRSATARPVGR